MSLSKECNNRFLSVKVNLQKPPWMRLSAKNTSCGILFHTLPPTNNKTREIPLNCEQCFEIFDLWVLCTSSLCASVVCCFNASTPCLRWIWRPVSLPRIVPVICDHVALTPPNTVGRKIRTCNTDMLPHFKSYRWKGSRWVQFSSKGFYWHGC